MACTRRGHKPRHSTQRLLPSHVRNGQVLHLRIFSWWNPSYNVDGNPSARGVSSRGAPAFPCALDQGSELMRASGTPEDVLVHNNPSLEVCRLRSVAHATCASLHSLGLQCQRFFMHACIWFKGAGPALSFITQFASSLRCAFSQRGTPTGRLCLPSPTLHICTAAGRNEPAAATGGGAAPSRGAA